MQTHMTCASVYRSNVTFAKNLHRPTQPPSSRTVRLLPTQCSTALARTGTVPVMWVRADRTRGEGGGGWKETVETMQHSIDVSDDGIRASFFLKGWLGDLVHRREFAAGVAPCKTGTNSLVLFADVKVRYISLISPNSVVKEAGKGFRPGKPKLNARHCPIMDTVVLTTSS